METILFFIIGLYLVALVSMVVLMRKYHKLECDEDPVPDSPSDYDYFEFSERPFINYN